MKKKILSLLALVFILSLTPAPAYAASDEAIADANALYQLGLFTGTGTDAQGNPIFQLDREPTRNEAVTMLVRLLGKEEEAKSKEWSTPFTDLESWVKPYVGYAYNNGLTDGTSGTSFGGKGAVTPPQYITFVLRALGYKDGVDFQWDKAWELSDKLGFTKGQFTKWGVQEVTVSGNTTSTTSRFFLRGDVAVISYNALSMKLKGTNTTLLENVKGGTSNAGEHTHNYVEKTVPGSGGHYEQVQVGTEKVFVRNETRQYSKCNGCGAIAYTNEEMYGHYDPNSPYFSKECWAATNLIYTEQVPIYEEKPVYENKWVEDTPATTIRVCSICGQQEPEAHTHKYIEKTVSGSGGHYEQVQMGTEKVQVGTEKKQYYECLHCGAHIYSYEDWEAHVNPETSSCLPGRNLIHTEYVPVYEEKPKYENKWVEDSATTIRVCSICGQQEP